MKFFLSTITIMAFVLALIITGCEKSEQTAKNYNNNGLTKEDRQMEQKINAFLNKMENPQKNDESLSVEETMWNIEAGLNYTYTDVSGNIDDVIIDSAKVELPLTNDEIAMTDVSQAYAMFEDSLLAFQETLDGSHSIYITDIQVVENLQKSNTVTLKSTSSAYDNPPGDAWNITSSDYWYWGWELGKCDGSGQGEGFDAADRIQQVANNNIPEVDGSLSVYPASVEIHTFNPADVPDNDNPYGSSMLFEDYQEETLNHYCLPPDEMTYYYNALEDIGANNQPNNKSIISYSLVDWTSYGDTGYPDYDDTWYMIHHAEITYGRWYQSSPPTE
ncbi:MAG: hypothetical protein K9I68_07215 [Bacteroidales bacterium]|nr:hypothetical protein [Bacteroidales bacterium]MCF8337987.1 hypothetical protein [Bacteroidales bacterium]